MELDSVNSRARRSSDEHLVLIVDDHDDSRELYVESLRRCGLRAVGAEDGLDALTKARRLRPSLIVMDLAMPGLDGFAATRILKRDRETRHLPVIALTGHCERHFRDLAFAAGVERVVLKPCLPEVLLAHVNELLARDAVAAADAM
jgi:two-component system, cell cycle response regulator DivK